jgi:hypothetical protein
MVDRRGLFYCRFCERYVERDHADDMAARPVSTFMVWTEHGWVDLDATPGEPWVFDERPGRGA